jgi:3-hydroxybutyryl-CoA dehydratase
MSNSRSRSAYRFEDLAVGMSAVTIRTFSRADIAMFRDLAPDSAPLHCDPIFAQKMGYGDILVFGWLAGAPFSGLLGMDLPGPATVLHSVRISMVAPVFPDEEICYQARVKQLSSATKAVVLDLVATRASNHEVVVRGQAQCGFRI